MGAPRVTTSARLRQGARFADAIRRLTAVWSTLQLVETRIRLYKCTYSTPPTYTSTAPTAALGMTASDRPGAPPRAARRLPPLRRPRAGAAGGRRHDRRRPLRARTLHPRHRQLPGSSSSRGSGDVPVLIAPGNHDPIVPDSLWRRVEPGPPTSRSSTEPRFRASGWQGVTVWGAGHDGPGPAPEPARRLRASRARARTCCSSTAPTPPPCPRASAPTAASCRSDIERTGAAYALLGHYHGARV